MKLQFEDHHPIAFEDLPDFVTSFDALKWMEWQNEIVSFLQEWLDENDHIVVKTSGSTGKPKHIRLSKSSVRASALKTLNYFDLSRDSSMLLCMPASFIAGKMMIVRALEGSLKLLAQKPRANPLKKISHPIDFIAMTPHQMKHCMMENPELFDLVDKVLLGGGPVSKKLQEEIKALSSKCYLSYGMTETISHVAIQHLNGDSVSEFFEALPGVKFSQGEEGQLIIHADHIDESPIITRDMVELFNEGRFQWKGRLDNVINSGGVKLYPETIEQKLSSYIARPFCIVDVPDDKYGRAVGLVIEGSRITIEKKFFRDLDKYEYPKYIYFLPSLEYTPTGKIHRQNTMDKVLEL